VVLKSPKVGFQQPKYSLGIQCVRADRPQTDYEALLPLYKTSRFSDALLNTAEVIFQTHVESTQRTSEMLAPIAH
jgi:hypothetical protein